MACNHAYYIGKLDILGRPIKVPCGRCLNCRLVAQKFLCDRMFCEYSLYKYNSFVTFTYDDEHLIINNGFFMPTLVKKHLQDYIDNIKHQIDIPFGYYGCGEYGDSFQRPHYHVLFFGLDYKKYKSFFEKTWKYGSIKILPVQTGSFKYVSKYITDSIGLDTLYFDTGRQKPFHVYSRGLGMRILLDHLDDFDSCGYFTYRGRKISVNRYYYNKLVHYSMITVQKRENELNRIVREDSKEAVKFNMSVEQYQIQKSVRLEQSMYHSEVNKGQITVPVIPDVI